MRAVAREFPLVELIKVREGQTGAISIQADQVSLSPSTEGIWSAIATLTASDGDAGGISMNVRWLDARRAVITANSGALSTSSSNRFERELLAGRGRGGDVALQATDSITLSDLVRVTTRTFGLGNAGRISITAPRLELHDVFISSASENTLFLFGIGDAGGGDAGDIDLDVGRLKLNNSSIDAETLTPGPGWGYFYQCDSVCQDVGVVHHWRHSAIVPRNLAG